MPYPFSLPSYTTPDPNKTLDQNNHTQRHASEEADIVALATKVGINGSADTSSIDYKLTSHIANTANPHSVTKSQVGLSNVDNTSDATKLAATLAAVYPVGSIYTSTVSTNPATLFGFGTWAAFAAGRVMVGVGTSDQTFAAGATGGESSHVLTTTEMPSHNHGSGTLQVYANAGDVQNTATNLDDWPGSGGPIRATHVQAGNLEGSTASTGGGAAHNNLQPYVTVYIWQRTA